MSLPNSLYAVVERTKVVDYLLAFDHPEGTSKAEFFTRFGFSADHWEVLALALVEHARNQPLASQAKTKYGVKYRIEGPIRCPDGRSPRVRAIWIIDAGGDVPRLVTAYPLE